MSNKRLELPQNKEVKINLNLAEMPIFKLNSRDKNNIVKIETEHGIYKFKADPLEIPDDKDFFYLLGILSIANKENSKKIEFSIYKFLKFLKQPINGKTYNQLEDCLKKWLSVSITFDGNYYENGYHTKKGFHILNYKILTKKDLGGKGGLIKIDLDEEFYEMNILSGFVKTINLNTYRTLSQPLARRLYLYLQKQFFNNKPIFKVSNTKMFPKLPLKLHTQNSRTITQLDSIKKAIERLNKEDENVNYTFKYYPSTQNDNEFILEFKRVILSKDKKQEEGQTELIINDEPIPKYPKYYDILTSEKYQQNKKVALEFVNKFETEELLENFLRPIHNSLKGGKKENINAYVYKCMSNENIKFKLNEHDKHNLKEEEKRAEEKKIIIQRAKQEELKNQRDKLRPKYDDLVKSKAIETFEKMEEQKQIKIIAEFEIYLESKNKKVYQDYKIKGLNDLLVKIEFKIFMLNKNFIQVMSFDEYVNNPPIPKQSTGIEKTRAVKQILTDEKKSETSIKDQEQIIKDKFEVYKNNKVQTFLEENNDKINEFIKEFIQKNNKEKAVKLIIDFLEINIKNIDNSKIDKLRTILNNPNEHFKITQVGLKLASKTFISLFVDYILISKLHLTFEIYKSIIKS